jgi:hypothetical protein
MKAMPNVAVMGLVPVPATYVADPRVVMDGRCFIPETAEQERSLIEALRTSKPMMFGYASWLFKPSSKPIPLVSC